MIAETNHCASSNEQVCPFASRTLPCARVEHSDVAQSGSIEKLRRRRRVTFIEHRLDKETSSIRNDMFVLMPLLTELHSEGRIACYKTQRAYGARVAAPLLRHVLAAHRPGPCGLQVRPRNSRRKSNALPHSDW
jgi:hypothetical protein